MRSKILNKIVSEIPKRTRIYHRLTMDIAQQVDSVLKRSGLKQSSLAVKLNKNESEISKWLSGKHNFTLKTIAKLEEVIKERVILVPNELSSYVFKSPLSITQFYSQSNTFSEIINQPRIISIKSSKKVIHTTLSNKQSEEYECAA